MASPRQMASRQQVGSIVGDVTTSTFRFRVEDEDLSATEYVRLPHEDERYLAQVIQIEREVDASDEEDEGDLLAEAKIVGRRDDDGRLTMPSTPPTPGTPVEQADGDLVRSSLNLQEEGAFLGQLRGLDLPVHLDVNGLVQKHCSILAKTGAGKSYALGVLMEELLKHNVPVVAVDPHGEHASLEAPNSSDRDVPEMRRFGVKPTGFEDQVVEFAPDQDAVPEARPLRLDERNLSARDITELLEDGLTSAQTGTLHQAIREIEEDTYGLEAIIASVEEQSGASKWPVLHALEDLQDLGILSSKPTPIEDIVADGQASILNLKGLAPGVQQLVVARVADRLFQARKIGRVPPHLFVLEEAHNFCPERHLSQAASGEVVRTIASEGRKFGMGLAVVSQRPAKVDKNVLSQCNTQIILKVTNANDLKTISKSVENLPEGIEEEIQALQVGTALVSEPSFAMPLFCKIRPRQTRHGGSSIEVVRDDDPDTEPKGPQTAAEELEGETETSQPTEQTEAASRSGHGESRTQEDPDEGPFATGDPPRVLIEVGRAEDALAESSLDGLSPGKLERLLVQIEGLLRVLDEHAGSAETDQARVAGLRSGLRDFEAGFGPNTDASGNDWSAEPEGFWPSSPAWVPVDGRLVIALVFVVGGAGVALAGVQPEASLTPTQALGQGSGEVRVKGVVADVDRVNDTFVLEDDEHELTVQMADVPVPVTPGKSLLAEGHLVQMSSTTVMQAEEIQMGCPSKYQS